jgi:hypothetical protein
MATLTHILRPFLQGMGVTGGTPIGFDVGAKEAGGTLRGLDLVRHARS